MVGPTTYSDWVKLLDEFGNGNDTVFEDLSNGSFTVDAGTVSRFYSRVEEAYKKRKQSWLDQFQRSFQFQNFKTMNDFEIALRNGKQNLYPLNKFVGLKGFPENLQKTLKKDLEDFVNEIKQSLKDNVSKNSNGKEQMLIMLNAFNLGELPEEIKSENKKSKEITNTLIPPTGRKILF